MEVKNLVFFTDLEQDHSIRIGISPLIGSISSKISSHKAAWPTIIRDQLIEAGYENTEILNKNGKDWYNFDVILLEHGMEFKGTFNVFGGANDEVYYNVKRILTPNVKFYSFAVDMPNIADFIRERLRTGSDLFKTLEDDIQRIEQKCASIPRVDFIEKTSKQIFGDSHSIWMYSPKSTCTRYDGLTMYGALKQGISSYIFPWTEDLVVYIGNIDVRHHLMRQVNPIESVELLMKDLEKQLLELDLPKITIRGTIPVENESRKIPKTGYYKGFPYFGTRDERAALSALMCLRLREMCEVNGWNYVENPKCFFNEKSELSFDVMEKPQSVHISREFYLWDFENRKFNTKIA